MSKTIYIRVKPNVFNPKSWDITVQTKGYPETVGFLDDKLSGLGGSRQEMFMLAEKLRKVEQENNKDARVIIVKS